MSIKIRRFAARVDRYFQEAIEMTLAWILLAAGVYTALPLGLVSTTSVYVSNLQKLLFGVYLVTPACILIWIRLRYGIHKYTTLFRKWRKHCLFFMTISLLYLMILRILITVTTPFYLYYFFLAAISYFCYLRLIR